MVSTHLKNMSQDGNLPQIGVKTKNIWNHQLELHARFVLFFALRIMWSQNWWFGRPRTLQPTGSSPSFWEGLMILRVSDFSSKTTQKQISTECVNDESLKFFPKESKHPLILRLKNKLQNLKGLKGKIPKLLDFSRGQVFQMLVPHVPTWTIF